MLNEMLELEEKENEKEEQEKKNVCALGDGRNEGVLNYLWWCEERQSKVFNYFWMSMDCSEEL